MKRMKLVLIGLSLLMALCLAGFTFGNSNATSQGFMDSQQNNSQNTNMTNTKKPKKNKNTNTETNMNATPTPTP